MDTKIFRLVAGFILAFNFLLNTCDCQQNSIFNQSPYQRQQLQQTQQLRQQLQQQQQRQQAFPNAFGTINPITSLGQLNTISPISPIGTQNPYRSYNQLQVNPQNFVPITAYQNEINYDGSFAYGYAAGDGTTAQAQGYVKNLGLGEAVEAQVVQGSYSYTSPEGTPITVRYIADENGFRAEGAHIPTPPPIPDAISKSLQYISNGAQTPYQQQILNPNLNPYQTPYRQFPQSPQQLRPGQQQLTPLQIQQQRIYQQQNSGQYQPENQFNPQQQRLFGAAGGGNLPPGQFLPGQQFSGVGSNFAVAQQQNLTNQQQQQQQNLQEQQAAVQQQQQQQQKQQQQQLITQELRGRPNQLVNPFGYNQYRRYKKAAVKN